MTDPSVAPPPYSPDRRTAVVLCGLGTHGAYHAGVLRALRDAGVRIDLVAGQGIGAAAAALAAIDAAARLWEPDGLWRQPATPALYGWKPPVRIAGWLVVAIALVLAAPAFVVAVGFLVHLVGFLLGMFGAPAGEAVGAWAASWMARLFAPGALPSLLPAVAVVVLALLGLVLVAGAAVEWWRAPARRRMRGGWWRLASAPLEADGARALVLRAIADLLQGAGPLDQAARAELGRRYIGLLADNVGQPGFRELILVTTDLDARRDVVGVLLREPVRREVLGLHAAGEERPDLVDLGGPHRELVLDLLAAAVTPPVGCDPHVVTFAPESFWRGETHRMCDRPAAVHRLLETVAAAGVSQVIVVSAIPDVAVPHRLQAPRLDLRGRLGEVLTADAAASLHDALAIARLRFDALYLVSPVHNPVGPFDLRGAWDQASDRWQGLEELMERGAEDAGRQFIGPLVGASGDRLADVRLESEPF